MLIHTQKQKRVAIAGLGAVGLKLATALDEGIAGLTLAAISARDRPAAKERLSVLRTPVPVLELKEIEPHADIVVECAPSHLLRGIVTPFVQNGKIAIVLSAGALLANMDLIELAKANDGQIVVPTGALIGLDAVTAAAEGHIRSVHMITRKPVTGLLGAPYLTKHGIKIEDIKAP